MTVEELEEFKEFALRPENSDKEFEFINGEIIELSPGRTSHSEFAMQIVGSVYHFCKEHKIQFHITGGDGAYSILGNTVAPDFAYKTTPMIDEYPDPVAPLWAVEVISPTDKPDDIRAKKLIYIEAGILYWEVYPKTRSIDVYAPGQPVRTVGIDGILDGGDVLTGFELPVKEIFSSE